MSLIVTTYAPEGIILAGDSRLTLNWNKEVNGKNTNYSITASDTNNKVFQIKDKFGLATFPLSGPLLIKHFLTSIIIKSG